jgi:aminoglycoside phosphotransferase family enzyme
LAPRRHSRTAELGLDAKVAFLREPASYPEPTYRVEALETHMSWVFLLDDFVYKLKKPVSYELLDFRPLAARRFYCDEELRLNLRLAPEVYLGLVPLTVDRRRHLALGGHGITVDWLVRMRRLPAEHMLDYAIMHHALEPAALVRLAQRLVAFYLGLPAETLAPEHYRKRFVHQVTTAWRELSLGEYELPGANVQAVRDAQLAALHAVGALLDERVRAGRIVEGHGDLRPEHVYLGTPLAIFDCLEFSRELRLADMADELSYLALECERLGATHAGTTLLRDYAALSGDHPAPALLNFYQSCRATTRAMIAARHLQDEKFRHSPHWVRRACQYLQLAMEHVGRCV